MVHRRDRVPVRPRDAIRTIRAPSGGTPNLSTCAGNGVAITDTGAAAPFRTVLASKPVRYAVVELLGRTVLIATWAHEEAGVDAVWAAADAVIATLEITAE